ncbi:unnamed protein product [Medioppia subpectinata]|uniref:Protein kinase domain-containing protein n=1 Tax=Medioppia subpectinata TaxID=1979941 RepID=A0A7R9PZK7_9ACAR|nr:unnamed protein product [Medioppia subpectinata]CAG2107058.1 unnamed protein product [Medioppia subpectinata]
MLVVTEAIDAVNGHSCGAVSLFMGVTRRTESDDTSGRKPVQCLVYEAYHSMAIKQMQGVMEQNMAVYDSDRIHKCYVCYQLGRVNVGQTSITVKELNNLIKIRSDYVVHYLNSWFESDKYYLQMELCADSLRNILTLKRRAFGRQTAAQAMNSYLHSSKPAVIHRNLKPDNVLIARTVRNGRYLSVKADTCTTMYYV